ncbi:MAG: DUF748 domain-containing protein [Saprospiraceae bacterium]|nr:DUF748 domain-containing protein [Saprospiraceae bacterium]
MAIPAFFKTKKGKIFIGIILLLIALRIALPYILLHYANKTLAEMKGYYGHVNDIDVALYRGAYTLDSFYLNKLDDKSDRQIEFISAQMVDLSLEWKSLFKGKLAGGLVFEQPALRFTENKVELKDVTNDTSDFRQLLRDFMPVEVNRCEIRDGSLRYIDNTKANKVDVAITHLNGEALNLRNAYDSNEVLPASIEATGDVHEGDMKFSMKLNPLAKQPQFDLNLVVERTNLVKLNDVFKAYGNFDVNKGEFNMYAEAATKDGKFRGYVKPIIHGLDVVEWKGQDKQDNFFQKLWETTVGSAAEVLQNQKKDQLATKINFEGTIEQPESNTWKAVVIVLQNAFVKALRPSIDNQINLGKVAKDKVEKKGFLKSLFSKNKDKKKKK